MENLHLQGFWGLSPRQEEEAEADLTARAVGAEEETSQARTTREVALLGDDEGRVPSPEPLVTTARSMTPTPRGETVPLEARLRWRAVYSDEVHGGGDDGDDGEATSSRRHRSEEVVEAGSSTPGGTTPRIGAMKRPWLFVNP